MQLTAGQKNLVNKTVDVSTFAIRWGFVPLIVYLGFKQGPDPMPNGQVRVVFFTFFWDFMILLTDIFVVETPLWNFKTLMKEAISSDFR